MLHLFWLKSRRAFARGVNTLLIFTLSFSSLLYVVNPRVAIAETTFSLYSQTTKETYSNFNDNGPNQAYAWRWTPTVAGVPTQLTLSIARIIGVPTGSICIRADKTATSASFGCANNITFTSGDNIIQLAGGAPLTAGTNYWIYFTRTSDASNYPSIQYKYPTAGAPLYRATVSGTDPTNLWFSNDIAMSVSGVAATSQSSGTTPPDTGSSQPIISTLTLYDQAQRNTYSGFNWNGAGDNYAWKWAPIANGIPNQIRIWTDHVTGAPTGDICIRATQSTTSASYGCATNVTLKAGENIIPLTGGQAVSWEGGNTYFVHFTRTSDANNYPSFQYRYPQANMPLYHSSVAGGEPTTLWFNYDIAMSIENVQYAPPPSTIVPAPLVIYAQDSHNTYSNFNWNGAGEEYAWQWEPQADGIPSQLHISLERTMGNPTGSFCIRAHKERTSTSFGCTGPVTFTAGQNVFQLTSGAPVYKTNVYYVHFTRTSDANNYPSIQYQTVAGKYAMYRPSTNTGDPGTKWFTADIAMTIRGTELASPAPVSNLIYGLTPDQALALYNKLGSVNRATESSYTAIEAGVIDNAASLAGAGRSTVLAPEATLVQAKEFPQYYYPYRYLIPEYSKSVIVGDTPIDSYVEYDQLGAALGKAPTMPVAPAPVDKTGYIYGMPRAEADAIYQLLKTGTIIRPGYIDAGDAGQINSDILWEISTYRIASGLYRVKYTTTGDCVTASSNQSAYWTHAYAEAHCYRDYSLDQMKASYAKPYHFLAPGFIAALSSTSVTSGISKAIAFSSAEIPYVIYFTTLESALGYPPSGAMTPNLTYEAPPAAGLIPITYATLPAQITLEPAIVQFAPTIDNYTPSIPETTFSDKASVAIPVTVAPIISSERITVIRDIRSGITPIDSANSTQPFAGVNSISPIYSMSIAELFDKYPAFSAPGAIDVVTKVSRSGWAVTEGFLKSLSDSIYSSISNKCQTGNSIVGTVANTGVCAGLVVVAGTFTFVNGVVDDVKIIVTGSNLSGQQVSGLRYGLAVLGIGSFFITPILKGVSSLAEASEILTRAGAALGDLGPSLKMVDGLVLDIPTAARITKNLDQIAKGGEGAFAAKDDLRIILKSALEGADGVSGSLARSAKVDQLFEQLRNVNPVHYPDNCVSCAIATDSTIAGKPLSAIPKPADEIWTQSMIENLYQSKFNFVKSYSDVEVILLKAGNGARGIAGGGSGSRGIYHVFNAVNLDGVVYFIDGQTGTVINGYYEIMNFMLTFKP